MGKPLDAIFFIAAVVLTLYRGSAVTFVTLYLPSLLLLNTTQKINLPGAPDMNCTVGVLYGVLAALVMKGGEPFPFKWGWTDTLMCLITLSTCITGMVTEHLYTGVSIFGEQLLGYLGPYFLARVMFHSPEMRRRALWISVICIFIIAFFALIEMRLWPYFLSRNLKSFGLFTGQNTMVLERFHLFRTQTTFDHPIDMGNSCLIVTAIIIVMAMTTSVGLKNIYVRLAILAGLGSSFSSLSFTAWVGIFATSAIFCTLWLLPFTRKLVIVAVLIMFGGFGYMTNKLYHTDVEARQEEEDAEKGQTVQDSMLVRAKIVQNCIAVMAQDPEPIFSSVGLFGRGNTIRRSELALESVDNSYMLFTMRRGFVFLILFLLLPVSLALRSIKAFRNARLKEQALPLAVAIATVLGVMTAMYTVWFGFAYSVLWTLMIGIAASMMDVLRGDLMPQQRAGAMAARQPMYGRGMALAQGV